MKQGSKSCFCGQEVQELSYQFRLDDEKMSMISIEAFKARKEREAPGFLDRRIVSLLANDHTRFKIGPKTKKTIHFQQGLSREVPCLIKR